MSRTETTSTLAALGCRPRVESDDQFLRELFASTRETELAALGGNDVLCRTFIDMQFRSRQFGYRAQFPASDCRIVQLGNSVIGQLWVDIGVDEIHLLDISLLPAYRGQGHGARLLLELQHEAASANRSISLQVAFDNPARRLYERLGFAQTATQGLHLHLRWLPTAASPIHPSRETVHEQT